MIRHLTVALALMLVTGPALALSCMRPDAVRMFEHARKSDDVYYVIKGRITPDVKYDVPDVDFDAPSSGKDVFADTPVQITGTGLGTSGFSVPVDVGATVRLKCLSVWCAGPPPKDEVLMFVKATDNKLILEVGPCGGTAIEWSQDAEKRLLACHLSDTCQPAEF